MAGAQWLHGSNAKRIPRRGVATLLGHAAGRDVGRPILPVSWAGIGSSASTRSALTSHSPFHRAFRAAASSRDPYVQAGPPGRGVYGLPDLRIALVRHPDFAKKVRSIVVEFGSTTEQSTLDRYIRGESVSRAQLERVWKTTSNGVWDSPIYVESFTAVRDVYSKLPADARIRVLGGDPGPTDQRDREAAAVAVLEEQVLSKHGKALVIYGAAHFYRAAPASFGTSADLARTLEKAHPGRIFTVIPVGGELDPPPPGVSLRNPDYRKFESALKTQSRPVLISLQRPPFRDLSAEEFLGGGIFSCAGPGGCRSAFAGSPLTLGQMADACVYLGIPQAGQDPKRRRSQ